MSRLTLIDVERAARAPRSKCRDLVPRTREECTRCRAPVTYESVTELALFRHGGYGADRETRFVVCTNTRCRAVRLAVVVEVNPRARGSREGT